MAADEVAQHLEVLVREVIAEAKDLRGDITAYEEAHLRERRAYRVIGVFLVGAIVVTLALLGTARASLQGTRQTLDYVKSCTTPDGECYKASRSGTVDFRQQLLAVVAVLTDCDVANDDLTKFRACVKERTGLDSNKTIPGGVDPTK